MDSIREGGPPIGGCSRFDTIIKRSLLALLVCVLVLTAFVAKFDFLSDVNAIDYAQIARNLAEGKGFSTSVATPLALAIRSGDAGSADLSRPPLHVAMLALGMRLWGPHDKTVALISIIFLLLTLAATFVIGRLAFGDEVAVYSVAITAVSTGLLAQALTGLETPLLALLFTLLFGLLLLHSRSEGPHSLLWPALTGLILGLCYLVRFECLAILPALLLFWALATPARRFPAILVALAVFAAVALPWVVRTNLLVDGVPASTHSYELLTQTVSHPSQTLVRQFLDVPPSPFSFIVAHPLQMLRKFNDGLRSAYAGVPQLLNPYVFIFFILAFFVGSLRRRCGLGHWCLAVSVILMTLGMCLYSNVFRLLLAFSPIVTLVATAAFTAYANACALRRQDAELPHAVDRFRTVALVAWVLVLAYPMADYLFGNSPTRQAAMIGAVRAVGGTGSLIATDMPWHVAWYGKRNTLLLPQSPRQLEALQQAGVRPDAIYLSPNLMAMPPAERMEGWQQLLLSGRSLSGYRVSSGWQKAGTLWVRDDAKGMP